MYGSVVFNAVIFAGLGIVIFVIAFIILEKMAPFHLWKEVLQERNVAAAVLAGAVVIGLCLIIAAAMH